MSAVNSIAYDSRIHSEDVTVTGAASGQLANLFAQVDDDEIQAIRVYVAGGGCGGMTYGMTYADNRSDYDNVMHGEGFDLYIDAVALNYLRGVEIDFVERETGSTFVFNNVFQATGGTGMCTACGGAAGGCG